MPSAVFHTDTIECNGDGGIWPVWKIGNIEKCRIQAIYTGARTEAVWQLQASLDGTDFVDVASTTITANGITDEMNVETYASLKLRLSTKETTTGSLRVRFILYGYWKA